MVLRARYALSGTDRLPGPRCIVLCAGYGVSGSDTLPRRVVLCACYGVSGTDSKERVSNTMAMTPGFGYTGSRRKKLSRAEKEKEKAREKERQRVEGGSGQRVSYSSDDTPGDHAGARHQPLFAARLVHTVRARRRLAFLFAVRLFAAAGTEVLHSAAGTQMLLVLNHGMRVYRRRGQRAQLRRSADPPPNAPRSPLCTLLTHIACLGPELVPVPGHGTDSAGHVTGSSGHVTGSSPLGESRAASSSHHQLQPRLERALAPLPPYALPTPFLRALRYSPIALPACFLRALRYRLRASDGLSAICLLRAFCLPTRSLRHVRCLPTRSLRHVRYLPTRSLRHVRLGLEPLRFLGVLGGELDERRGGDPPDSEPSPEPRGVRGHG
eukprot:110117-Rhodomonas_salina.2